MADRPEPTPLAATGIWIVALVGSWAMALAILGSIDGDMFDCDSDRVASRLDGVGAVGWVILGAAALVPVLVITAVAPAPWRSRLIGWAMAFAVLGLLVANVWIGPCL